MRLLRVAEDDMPVEDETELRRFIQTQVTIGRIPDQIVADDCIKNLLAGREYVCKTVTSKVRYKLEK